MTIGDGRCPNCGEDEMDGARCYYCGYHEYSCDMPDCTWCSDAQDVSTPSAVCDTPIERFSALARSICDSDRVLSTYAACEWDELGEDGRSWLCAIVREVLIMSGLSWHMLGTAPRGKEFIAYSQGHELPPFVSLCKWHPSAGFCTCELREPTHWLAPAQAIEARRAETLGSVHESAVRQDAPTPSHSETNHG